MRHAFACAGAVVGLLAAGYPALGQESTPEGIIQQLRSIDSVYEAAFTATGTRLTASGVISEIPPLSKKWKITMADGKTAYEEQVVQVLRWEDIPWVKGDASKPVKLNARDDSAPMIALKTIWLFEPTMQAKYDFVGSIPPAGKPLENVEGHPALSTAGSLAFDEPSAPTYTFDYRSPGRLYGSFGATVQGRQ
jgi:hypothetical protein